jgi:hypothetical protein
MSKLALPFEVALTDLIVDVENPRLDEPASDERGAIMGILQEQGMKLVNLAQHLAENGPSPAELNLVFPSEDGRFVVAEGNRRTAALKILHNLKLIQGADPKFVRKFAQIASEASDIPTSLLCAVEQSEERRNMWLKLRHTGENQGRGLSGWDAKEQTRFLRRHDGEQTARMEFGLRVVEMVRARCSLTNEEEADIRVIPITTLERMVGDPEVRKVLGIERSADGVIIITVDDDEAVLQALKALVLEIAQKRVQVGKLMKKEDRRKVFEAWPDWRKPGQTAVPMPPRTFTLKANVGSPSSPNVTHTPTPASAPTVSQAGPSQPGSQRSWMPSSPDQRKTVIPLHLVLKIADKKIKRVFIELKKLDVETYENAVGVLLRVFLELSLEAFLTANQVVFYDHEKLRNKMAKVADFWEANKILTRNQLTAWRNAAGSNDLFSLNVLHAHVHSLQSIPKKRDLLRTWDEMEMYFMKLWA